MKYVSLDLETTCLTTAPANILEFAAVIEDTEQPDLPIEDLPTFHRLVKVENYGGDVVGSHYALAMNAGILAEISGYKGARPRATIVNLFQLEVTFLDWLTDNGLNNKVTLAGKNVAIFDYQFLTDKMKQRCSHRMLDVGSVYFDHKTGIKSSDQLLVDHGIREAAAHDALTDARDVIRLLRLKYA